MLGPAAADGAMRCAETCLQSTVKVLKMAGEAALSVRRASTEIDQGSKREIGSEVEVAGKARCAREIIEG